ncbi:hypothetical protein BGW39_005464 [Mortierella sp. 14UC]|nr:hypothetical protein BGW39_005464 [Mortierella sp. 14UC]
MLQEVLPLVPDLVQFGMPYLSPETAAVLAKHCPRAQSFLQTFKKSTIHRERPQGTIVANGSGIVLASCPHLTVFDGLHHEIQAQYLLEYPWSCEGLVILCLQIVGVTRLSEEEEMDYKQGLLFQRTNRTLSEAEVRAVEKYEQQVQEQHRQIYGQLAKLVSLRVLELGMEYRPDVKHEARFKIT